MSQAHWSNDLVGLPWRVRGRSIEGVDCWGLAWLAWRTNGIDVPSYAEDYVDEREAAEIDSLIAMKAVYGPWQPIDPGCEVELDLLVFRCASASSHVGVVVGKGMMLHIMENGESCVESYRRGRWAARVGQGYRFAP